MNDYEIGPIRPPSEAQSLLLRVTRNCPWNQCLFCHTYKGTKFSFRSVEEIKGDIDTVKQICDEILQLSWSLGFGGDLHQQVLRAIWSQPGRYGPTVQTIAAWLYFGAHQAFLQDANSIMAKTADLLEIIRYLKEKFPSIERITSYGRARTLSKKTVAELKELKEAGLSRIHIGMETGYGPLLQYMKKGVTPEEQIRGGRNVVEAGISLCEYVMPGLGGKRWWREHAVETARVLNQIDPDYIRLRSLYIRRDMPLYQKHQDGDFIRLTDDETIAEIRLFIENLNGIRSTLVSDHILNLLEEVQGKLPEEKDKMIALLDRYLALPREERLRFRVGRRAGAYRSLYDLQDPHLRRQTDSILANICRPESEESEISEEVEKEIYALMESYI